jgi:hypothetical protein
MVQAMREGEISYSAEETALLAEGMALLGSFAVGGGKLRSLTHSKTIKVAQTKHDKKSGLLVGHVEAVVGASPEQIVAFLMHFDSKYHSSLLSPVLDVRHETLEVVNRHHKVVFIEMKTAPLRNRTWLTALLWQKVCDAPLTYVWVGVPIEHHAKVTVEDEAHAVRAGGARCFRCTRIGDNETQVEYACSLDLRGHVPQWLTDSVATPEL